MDFKTKIRNPKIQQGVLEVVFPVTGYLFWDWSLMIIVVFYLVDYLASQIFYIKRLHHILSFHQKEKFKLISSAIFSFLIFYCGELLILDDSFSFIYKQKDEVYTIELIKFMKDEGWYLFPTVLLLYYMMDKMFFYMPRRYSNLDAKIYGLKHLVLNIIILFLIGVGKVMFDWFHPHDLIVIGGIIIVKLVFDEFVKKKWLGIQF